MIQPPATATTVENIEQRVVRLLHAHVGDRVPICPETQLLRDLHLWGDDAGNFFGEFTQQFGVDMRAEIFSDYFPAEGQHVALAFKRLLTGHRMHDYFRAITVADLANSAALGHWVVASTSET